jgi:uncharacterized lipoprotein YmbA
MSVTRSLLSRIFAIAAILACAGCAESPSPRLFLLAPTAPAATHPFNGVVALKNVESPAYLDRPQFVRFSDPHEMTVSELERWGEGTSAMVTRVLVSNLAQRLPEGQVFASAGPLSVDADVVIEVVISRFEPEPDGAVALAGQWVVQRDDQPRRLRAASIRTAAPSAATPALVAAMSDALAKFADEIAASIGRPPEREASTARDDDGARSARRSRR